MAVRWLFQEVQYPTADSNKRKSNHLTNKGSFPRTQGLGFLDYKDPLEYGQYSRWERDPLQGTSLCHFRIRGTKKKSQELPGRKYVIHKGVESQPALNNDPAETMGPQTPNPEGKICTKPQISWEGRHFQTGKNSWAPYSGETECAFH